MGSVGQLKGPQVKSLLQVGFLSLEHPELPPEAPAPLPQRCQLRELPEGHCEGTEGQESPEPPQNSVPTVLASALSWDAWGRKGVKSWGIWGEERGSGVDGGPWSDLRGKGGGSQGD